MASPKKVQQVNLITPESSTRTKTREFTAAELDETIDAHEKQVHVKLHNRTTEPPTPVPNRAVFNVTDAIEVTPTFESEAELIAWLTR